MNRSTISVGIILVLSDIILGDSLSSVLVEISTNDRMAMNLVRCRCDKSLGNGIYGFGNKDKVDNLFRRSSSAGICFYQHT